MAKPDHSIDPRILESAKQEFLRNGYENASLKNICDGAGVTTGALYKRYRGKSDLFDAVVDPTIQELYQTIYARSLPTDRQTTDEELIACWEMTTDSMLYWFNFLYERYDYVRLLFCGAEGTSKSNFCHDLVEVMTDCSYEYYKEAHRRGLAKCSLDKAELHILLTSFWATIFEPVIHEYSWDQIICHSGIVCKLFNWYSVLGFQV